MAPVKVTDDYYLILDVHEDASTEEITRSYRRLAFQIHPDRSDRSDATEAFQKIGQAYETLKDDEKRRQYNRVYGALRKARPPKAKTEPQPSRSAASDQPSPSGTSQFPPEQRSTPKQQSASEPRPRPSQQPSPKQQPTSEQHPEPGHQSEREHLAGLEKSRADRESRWKVREAGLLSDITERSTVVHTLEGQIKNLQTIRAADDDAKKFAEIWEKSWGRTVWHLFQKEEVEDEAEACRKDRERQERMVEESLKQRRLDVERKRLVEAREKMEAFNNGITGARKTSDREISMARDRIAAREEELRQEAERLRREASLAQDREEMARWAEWCRVSAEKVEQKWTWAGNTEPSSRRC